MRTCASRPRLHRSHAARARRRSCASDSRHCRRLPRAERVADSSQQFSGPEINPADIIVSEKISDDEKSSYGAVLKV